MTINKYTSILLITTFLAQSLLPACAMEREPEKAPLIVLSQKGKTAAGILHYALHNNEIYIPLGRRDDSENGQLGDWCNFGGDSEEMLNFRGEEVRAENLQPFSTLDQDAARESGEESNGIYAPHPRILKHCPFIDVLTERNNAPLLFRMYWQRIQYIAPEIFKEKLQEASLAHNKEFTDLIWVKATDLFTAVIMKDPILRMGKTELNIYRPLFDTLSTASGKAFLEKLSYTKTLKTTFRKDKGQYIYSSIRPYVNLHYNLGSEGTADQFYQPLSKHPTVTVLEANETHASKPDELYVPQEPSKLIFLLQQQKIENQKEDAIFHKLNPDTNLFRPNHYETIQLKNAKEEDDLAEAIAAHGMAMVELKRRFAASTGTTDVPEWKLPSDESLSRIHLRIVLGPDYKTPEHFKEEQNARRAADIATVKEYFRRYTQVEYDQKVKGDVAEKDQAEFKREIHLLDSDYEFFADVLSEECELTGYHGASENLNNLFKSFTYLRKLIDLRPLDDLVALRGTDIYFKDVKTMQQLLAQTGDCESKETRAAMIFLNFTLFAGMKTSVSTSSSSEYVLNDHSVSEPDMIERFEEALALAGFSKPIYDYYQSLFEQYIKYKNAPYGNSVLIAITQTPEDIDSYNYASSGGGRYYSISSTLQVVQNIQAEAERQKIHGAESFDIESDRKRALFPENRTWLHPHRVMNASETKIISFNRFPLSQQEQQAYDQEMGATTVAMLADWLAQKSTVMEGSFIEYPALKKLHKMVYKGITGQDIKETFNVDGFIHLIQNGHLDAVKSYLINYPDVLKHEAANPKALIKAALCSNNLEQVDYFLNDILNLNMNDLLTKEEFICQMREFLEHFQKKSFFHLLKHYDISQVDDSIILNWMKTRPFQTWQTGEPVEEYLEVVHQAAPHLIRDVMDCQWKAQLDKNQVGKIIDKNFMDPQQFLEMICTHIYKEAAINTYHAISPGGILDALIEKGADIRVNLPLTHEPLAFIIATITNCHFNSTFYKNFLPYGTELLNLRNSEGLTLMQFMQKNALEKKQFAGLFDPICNLHRAMNGDYTQDSYPPYINYFGNKLALWLPETIFTIPENQNWIERLQAVQEINELCHLVDTCPDKELLIRFREKIEALVQNLPSSSTALSTDLHTYLRTAADIISKKESVWIDQAKQLITPSSGDIMAVEAHLNQAPNQKALHRTLGSLIRNDRFISLLPAVLQRLYPNQKAFISETQFYTSLEFEHATPIHPVIISAAHGHTHAFKFLVEHLGLENIPLLSFSYAFDSVLESLSDDQLENLYTTDPAFFVRKDKDIDFFLSSLRRFPTPLKSKFVLDNIEKLREINQTSFDNLEGFPYFWLLLKDDSNLSLIQTLLQIDQTLLDLKTLDGFGLEYFFKQLPKNKVVGLVKKHLNERRDSKKTAG
jgi:hypothetical protein